MHRILVLAVLLFAGSTAVAATRQCVPATHLIAAAQAALEAKATAAHLDAHFASVGSVGDVTCAQAGTVALRALVQESWLRARIGVPVQVSVADHPVSSVIVWFAVTAPDKALVYSAAFARNTAATAVQTTMGTIDRARTQGLAMVDMNAVAGQRLRHPVAAGAAALPSDFEASPAVQAQQQVRIDAVSGVVRLSTTGRALADGQIGQTIPVLPADASQPVHARVVSDEAVTIEN